MVLGQNIAKSTKRMGRYEEKIIESLKKHFLLKGYEVIPHSSLNIAWGSIISDIDVLLLKNQTLTCIEVKSSRDNLARAKQQIDRLMDYVDYAFVATDKQIKSLDVPNVGLLHVEGESITVLKRAKKFSSEPRFYSMVALKKKCIAKFFGTKDSHIMIVNKYELAQAVYFKRNCSRECLKEIVTCAGICNVKCPIRETGQYLNASFS